MTARGTGKHRADVDINVLESFELRSRRAIRDAERARLTKAQLREQKRLEKLEHRYQKQQAKLIQVPASSQNQTGFVVPAPAQSRFARRRPARSLLTMITASGLFATVSLPAYAFDPELAAMARFTTTSAEALMDDENTQNLTVAALSTIKFDRGDYEASKVSAVVRQDTLTNYRTYTGPTAKDFLKNPPFSRLDSSTLLKVAAKYVGTPYVFGGATPRGFDCSGYVLFVLAQFGVELPHSVHMQSRLGIKIRPADARPGDIVIFNDHSHNGIYAGNGNFYHAPRPGDSVKLAPIFTDSYYFVRFATD